MPLLQAVVSEKALVKVPGDLGLPLEYLAIAKEMCLAYALLETHARLLVSLGLLGQTLADPLPMALASQRGCVKPFQLHISGISYVLCCDRHVLLNRAGSKGSQPLMLTQCFTLSPSNLAARRLPDPECCQLDGWADDRAAVQAAEAACGGGCARCQPPHGGLP